MPVDRTARAAKLLSEALAVSLSDGIHLAADLARDMAEAIEMGRLPNGPTPDVLRTYADMIERTADKAEALASERRRDH